MDETIGGWNDSQEGKGAKILDALRRVWRERCIGAKMVKFGGIVVPPVLWGWVLGPEFKTWKRVDVLALQRRVMWCGLIMQRMSVKRNIVVITICMRLDQGVLKLYGHGVLKWYGHMERMSNRRLNKINMKRMSNQRLNKINVSEVEEEYLKELTIRFCKNARVSVKHTWRIFLDV